MFCDWQYNGRKMESLQLIAHKRSTTRKMKNTNRHIRSTNISSAPGTSTLNMHGGAIYPVTAITPCLLAISSNSHYATIGSRCDQAIAVTLSDAPKWTAEKKGNLGNLRLGFKSRDYGMRVKHTCCAQQPFFPSLNCPTFNPRLELTEHQLCYALFFKQINCGWLMYTSTSKTNTSKNFPSPEENDPTDCKHWTATCNTWCI